MNELEQYGEDSTQKTLIFIGKSFRVDINKCNDEWYYIEYSPSYDRDCYYKCDQFDGLLNCLDYLKSIC